MMIITFVLFIFLIILGWLVLRQPPDERVKLYRLTLVLQWLGFIILIGFAGFWAWWGIAEMGSDPSGFIHLLPVIPIAGLIYLGWRRPRVVGWGLVILGVASALMQILLASGQPSQELDVLMFVLLSTAAPFLISGLCLIAVAELARRFSSQGKISSGPWPNRLIHGWRGHGRG